MARIRSVHPGLWTDEFFAPISDSAQIFYIGLLTECDDRGVFEWKPWPLRMKLRPAKDGNVEPLLQELVDANKIIMYEVNGRQLGAVRNFMRFQSPRKPTHLYPVNKEVLQYVGFNHRRERNDGDLSEPSTVPSTVKATSVQDGEGKGEGKGLGEGKGEKKKGVEAAADAAPKPKPEKPLRGTRLPPDWIPDENDVAKLIEQNMGQQTFERELEKFKDYWKARPGAGGVKLDWNATYRNWMAKVRDDGKFTGV